MTPPAAALLQHLADAVLVLHLAVVLFVAGGLVAIVAGNLRGWRWANAPAFRWTHLALIGTVVVQSWFGLECPLTTLENGLRSQAGAGGYGSGRGFIQHWVSAILFYQAPAWAFAVAYTTFGAAVLASWLAWPPRRWRAPPVTPR